MKSFNTDRANQSHTAAGNSIDEHRAES